MFSNYLKIAIRNLLRKKGFSLINILGLGIGLACCLLILLHVQDELSYDRHHERADRIYRMALDRIYPEHTRHYAIIPSGFAPVVASDFPEVEKATRMFRAFGETVFRMGEQVFRENRVMAADSNVFEVFSLPLLMGDPATALNQPDALVMTESAARKYFGQENPIGKQLTTDFGEVMVTGVAKDLPENSHFTFDMLFSTEALGFIQQPNYISFSVYTYLLLKSGTDPAALEAKFPALVEQYAAGQIQGTLNMSYEEYTAAGNGYHYFLQPLTDIHLHSHLENEPRPTGNIAYVYLFSAIALFILLLACINFMNLSTARSAERAREVGVRKVLGSLRKQLVGQFLVESVLVSLMSLLLAIALVRGALPFFNELAGKNLHFDLGQILAILPFLLAFAVVVGVLAGIYPAFILSSFRPVTVLKGNFKTSQQGLLLRNGLVVFQFGISIVLIAATLLVYRQMQYLQTKNLGFNKEQVVILERFGALQEKAEAFKQELLRYPNIMGAGGTQGLPGGYHFGYFIQKRPNSEPVTTSGTVADEDFIANMGMEMVAGRAFSPDFNDSLSIILNETAARELNLENPIGANLYHRDDEGELSTLTVIGVVKDYHFQSLHQRISPLVMLSSEGDNPFTPFLAVRLAPEDIPGTLAFMESSWQKFAADQPFVYSFFDEELAEMYADESRVSRITTAFSGLAIWIACIGLFGLSAFTAQQRTKEIGIRKVMGATVVNIVVLLSRHFTVLILIAMLVAVPLIWLMMGNWVNGFAYHIDIAPWKQPLPYLASGLIALFVALATVSFQSIKAALTNPVTALKNE